MGQNLLWGFEHLADTYKKVCKPLVEPSAGTC